RKRPSRDVLRAARELEVEWIVDGALERGADRVRGTVRLVRASDGTSAWSSDFDEKLAGIFQLEDQIAQQVAGTLAPVLRARGHPTLMTVPETAGTRSVEAYELYLTAVQQNTTRTQEGHDRAIILLRQALKIDPGFARAWTLLAEAQRFSGWGAGRMPEEVFR